MREARERASADHRSGAAALPTSWSRRPRAPRSTEGARIVAAAQQQIELETTRARESLRREVAGIAVERRLASCSGARSMRATHAELLDQLAAQI